MFEIKLHDSEGNAVGPEKAYAITISTENQQRRVQADEIPTEIRSALFWHGLRSALIDRANSKGRDSTDETRFSLAIGRLDGFLANRYSATSTGERVPSTTRTDLLLRAWAQYLQENGVFTTPDRLQIALTNKEKYPDGGAEKLKTIGKVPRIAALVAQYKADSAKTKDDTALDF